VKRYHISKQQGSDSISGGDAEKYYIARKYVGTEGEARFCYEEGIFSSYERAHDFIIAISEEDDDCFLSEIVGYPLDSHSPCDSMDVFTFDRTGKLMHSDKAENWYDNCHIIDEDGDRFAYEIHDPASYNGKYKDGDIVFIRAFPWNLFSPTHKNTIGVICCAPDSFEEWVSNGNEYYTWDNTYAVDCIRDGYLGHWHIEEKGIAPFDGEIPDNLKFLQILSEYYKGNKVLSPEVEHELKYGDLFVENVKHFNFEE
jgi:hypothetical protein